MLHNLISSNAVLFGAAFALAFTLTLGLGKHMIPWMKNAQRRGQPIRTDGVSSHSEKQGTPTMGGLIFIPAILISSLLFMDWSNLISWLPLMGMVGFGIMGWMDDYNKVVRGNSYTGLTQRGRLIIGGVITVVLTFLIDGTMPAHIPMLSVVLPFGVILPVGIFYFVWSYFVIVGTANAANLSDGLDGLLSKIYLAPMVVMTVALIGVTRVGFFPNMVFLPEAVALFPLFGAVIGAVLGFLWFNSKPASIFMGDVGSLALGGFLGTSALILKSEIAMGVASMMMVIILISAAIQMIYYKAFARPGSKPPFLIAPIHHHYEQKGAPETKITERFFILSIIFAGIAIVLLRV